MPRSLLILIMSLVVGLILTGCNITPTPVVELPKTSPTSQSAPVLMQPGMNDGNPVVFSEILAGSQGNNYHEFIELYNRSGKPVDLLGWSIWYRLPSSKDDLLVYRWKDNAIIPPLGHYLLGHVDQALGILVDATYEQQINTVNGGLQLRQMDGSIHDIVGWGKSAPGFYNKEAAPSLSNDISLERLPGGFKGNQVDTDHDSTDFVINNSPNPQNTGSEITPSTVDHLTVSLTSAASIQPGNEFTYTLIITNTCNVDVKNITATIPLLDGLILKSIPAGVNESDRLLTWSFDSLHKGENALIQIKVQAPWTYLTTRATGYFTKADNCPFPAYGSPALTVIEGGVIPIEIARGLVGADLTIEGTVTMPTGALYAGSGNTKFYLQDDSGGIQVYVVGGQGKVGLNIGSHVSVRGNIQAYRGAMEIVPIVVPNDILRIDNQDNPRIPLEVSIHDASNDLNTLPGKLIKVEGVVNRVEEFSYSYEIDLMDESGELVTLYVDKQTGINVERIEVGHHYQATGVLEIKDTLVYLYPRIQEDLKKIYPPVLMVDVDAPAILSDQDLITYTINLSNHTPDVLSKIIIQAAIPEQTILSAIENEGSLIDSKIVWTIPELSGHGDMVSVRFTVRVNKPAPESVLLENPVVEAAELTDSVIGNSIRTFSGSSIPIWAIQGDGFRSSYAFKKLTTRGIITGIFPGLGGFFIQEIEDDINPLTSHGLFINTGKLELPVYPGDLVEVSGIVREISNQTSLQVTDIADVWIVSQSNSLPTPIDLDPPDTTAQADIYYEALEGMYVQVSGPAIAVSPTSKYGEYVLVLPYHDTKRLFQGDDNGFAIMIDDGMSIVHSDNTTLPYSISAGDLVGNITGPLAFTYGRYKVEPVEIPDVQENVLSPTPIEISEDEFSLMTWNAENLFDYLEPNPSDPPRPTLFQYQNSLTKVANTIIMAGSPTIIALQEVENIGVLQDLAKHDLLLEFNYQPILLEGSDSRGIDVGYLVRGDTVEVLKIEQRNTEDDLFSRPPLVLQVNFTTGTQNIMLFLINNHFASMSSGVDVSEPQRTAQASWNATLVQEIQRDYPDALIAVMGDLNSFYVSKPINTLLKAGLHDVFDNIAEENRYTYIFEGQSQVLDHILMSPSLMEIFQNAEILRTNADYPPQDPKDPSPLRKSDHDPLIAIFRP